MSFDDFSVGWYGKLPSLGDFASRRLDPDFIEAWDHWLAEGLSAWQAQAPDTWLDHYLGGPSWRFVLMPGAMPALDTPLGPQAWAGVLMPSVDRVGRYFPLTLAQPLQRLPQHQVELDSLLAWLTRLDDLAADALHEDWPIDQLEEALAALGNWRPEARDAATTGSDGLLSTASAASAKAGLREREPGAHQEWRPSQGVADWMAQLARQQLNHELQGHTLWLSHDPEGRPRLRNGHGLPQGSAFASLLAGAPLPSSLPSHRSECP